MIGIYRHDAMRCAPDELDAMSGFSTCHLIPSLRHRNTVHDIRDRDSIFKRVLLYLACARASSTQILLQHQYAPVGEMATRRAAARLTRRAGTTAGLLRLSRRLTRRNFPRSVALASRAAQPARRASPAILGCYRSRAAAKQPVGSLTTAGRMPRRLSARSDPPRLRALIVQIVHLILARPSSL